MNRSSWLVAAVSVPLLCAGMCGSVLRGYHPVDWPTGSMGGFVSTSGDFDIRCGGLIDRMPSYAHFEIKNRGTEKARVVDIELTAGDSTSKWEPSNDATILPDSLYVAEPSWDRTIDVQKCEVRIRIKVGENYTTIRIPFLRN